MTIFAGPNAKNSGSEPLFRPTLTLSVMEFSMPLYLLHLVTTFRLLPQKVLVAALLTSLKLCFASCCWDAVFAFQIKVCTSGLAKAPLFAVLLALRISGIFRPPRPSGLTAMHGLSTILCEKFSMSRFNFALIFYQISAPRLENAALLTEPSLTPLSATYLLPSISRSLTASIR